MRLPRHFVALVALLSLLGPHARADEGWHTFVSYAEFEQLVVDLAPRVNLFAAIWEVDPNAEMYGGTSRDFAWLLRKKIASCKNRAAYDALVVKLRQTTFEIRDFVAAASDVDVISTVTDLADAVPFDADFITRIEVTSPAWFQPGTEFYRQEVAQGGVPVEKIRLGRGRIIDPADPALAGGLGEIYRGLPTLRLKASLQGSKMFDAHELHPVLTVLRYLRQVAVSYYQRFGKNYPTEANLRQLLDAESERAARREIEAVRENPGALDAFLQNSLFQKRLRKQLEKIFRSHTNPTAAKMLFEWFHVDEMLLMYQPIRVAPYHTVAYAKRRVESEQRQIDADPLVAAAVKTLGVFAEAEGLALEHSRTGLPVVPLLHGTPYPSAYRSIVFVGAVESGSGSAGAGVYATDLRHREFAEGWRATERGPGVPPLVARLRIDAKARFLDLTSREGVALKAARQLDEDALAEALQVDVVRFAYSSSVAAYAVKNGAVILETLPDSVPLHSLAQLRELLQGRRGDVAYATGLLLADPSLVSRVPDLLADWEPQAALTVLAAAMENAPTEALRRWNSLQESIERRFGKSSFAQLRGALVKMSAVVEPNSISHLLGSPLQHLKPFIQRNVWTRQLFALEPEIDALSILLDAGRLEAPLRYAAESATATLWVVRENAERLLAAAESGPGSQGYERLRVYAPLFAVASRRIAALPGEQRPDTGTLLRQAAALPTRNETDSLLGRSPFRTWEDTLLSVLLDDEARWRDAPEVFRQEFRRAQGEHWVELSRGLLAQLWERPQWTDRHWRWFVAILDRLSPYWLRVPPPSMAMDAFDLHTGFYHWHTGSIFSQVKSAGGAIVFTFDEPDIFRSVEAEPDDRITPEGLAQAVENPVTIPKQAQFEPTHLAQRLRDAPDWVRELSENDHYRLVRSLLFLWPHDAEVFRILGSWRKTPLPGAMTEAFGKLVLGRYGHYVADKGHAFTEAVAAYFAGSATPVTRLLQQVDPIESNTRFLDWSPVLRGAGPAAWPEGPETLRNIYEYLDRESVSDLYLARVLALPRGLVDAPWKILERSPKVLSDLWRIFVTGDPMLRWDNWETMVDGVRVNVPVPTEIAHVDVSMRPTFVDNARRFPALKPLLASRLPTLNDATRALPFWQVAQWLVDGGDQTPQSPDAYQCAIELFYAKLFPRFSPNGGNADAR